MSNNLKSVADTELTGRIKRLVTNGALSKSDFLLGNVDNTSDADKPVSIAQQTALDLKVDNSSIDANDGVAGLDSSGKLATSVLPTLGLADSLSDVQITSASNSQVLTYNSATSKWINASNLGLSEVVIGVGEGASPTSVLLRGPQASGTSVVPGDFKIRAEGGTGYQGSGSVVFQTAAPTALPEILFSMTVFNTTASTTGSVNLLIPSGYSNTGLLVQVSAPVNTSTLSSITLGGTALTTLSTASGTTQGITTVAYIMSPVASASAELAFTLANSTLFVCTCTFFANVSAFDGFVSSTFVQNNSLKTVSGLVGGDLVVDCVYFKANATCSLVNEQTLVCSIDNSSGSPAVRSTCVLSCRLTAQGETSFVMKRNFNIIVQIIHLAVVARRVRPDLTTVPTFKNSLILDSFGTLRVPFPRQNWSSETTNINTTIIKFLTANSPTTQIFQATNPAPAVQDYRICYLPPAHSLNIGHFFYVVCQTITNRTLIISSRTRNTFTGALSNTSCYDGINLTHDIAIGSTTNSLGGKIVLIDKNNGEGVWEYIVPATLTFSF